MILSLSDLAFLQIGNSFSLGSTFRRAVNAVSFGDSCLSFGGSGTLLSTAARFGSRSFRDVVRSHERRYDRLHPDPEESSEEI